MTQPDPHGDPTAADEVLGPEPPPWDAFEEPERPARSRRLVVLAAIPWLLVMVLVLRTVTGGSGGVPQPVPTAGRSADGVGAAPAAETAPELARDPSPDAPATATPPPAADDPPGSDVALRFGARVAPGPDDAAAVAVVVARTWLGSVGPRPPVDVGTAGIPPAYVEHLTVEAVDLPTPDTAVATVVAVLLDAEGDTYTSARIVRLGVPIVLDRDGARPAGDPWWLPAPDLSVRSPVWTAVEDPEELARAGAALADAGYTDVTVGTLETSPTWPLRVTATASAPGSDTPRDHVVWLREHLGELVVAGVLPPAPEERS